jgi:hypothetical protein
LPSSTAAASATVAVAPLAAALDELAVQLQHEYSVWCIVYDVRYLAVELQQLRPMLAEPLLFQTIGGEERVWCGGQRRGQR